MASNFEEVINDMAKGYGEHLDGLALTMGCTPQSVKDFAKYVKDNYSKMHKAPQEQPIKVLENIRSQVNVHPWLGSICQHDDIS